MSGLAADLEGSEQAPGAPAHAGRFFCVGARHSIHKPLRWPIR
jgi:hypothetical protein